MRDEHVLQVAHLRALLDEINAGLGDTTTALTTERDATRGQRGTQRQQLNRLMDALALGTIDPAAIAERVNDLKRSTDLLPLRDEPAVPDGGAPSLPV